MYLYSTFQKQPKVDQSDPEATYQQTHKQIRAIRQANKMWSQDVRVPPELKAGEKRSFMHLECVTPGGREPDFHLNRESSDPARIRDQTIEQGLQ